MDDGWIADSKTLGSFVQRGKNHLCPCNHFVAKYTQNSRSNIRNTAPQLEWEQECFFPPTSSSPKSLWQWLPWPGGAFQGRGKASGAERRRRLLEPRTPARDNTHQHNSHLRFPIAWLCYLLNGKDKLPKVSKPDSTHYKVKSMVPSSKY